MGSYLSLGHIELCSTGLSGTCIDLLRAMFPDKKLIGEDLYAFKTRDVAVMAGSCVEMLESDSLLNAVYEELCSSAEKNDYPKPCEDIEDFRYDVETLLRKFSALLAHLVIAEETSVVFEWE